MTTRSKSIARRLMAALPNTNDPLTGVGGPGLTMTNTTTRLGLIAQHPKRLAVLAIVLISLLSIALPHVASADSIYNDEACHGGSLVWTPFTTTSTDTGATNECPMFAAYTEVHGWGNDSAMWSFDAPAGTTLSALNVTGLQFTASDGYGSGLLGDTGSGFTADNDPRILNEGKAIPDTTGGDTANCWGYGGNGNGAGSANYTQNKNADHGSSGCIISNGAAGYNLQGGNYVGIGVGAQQRACSDTADGGDCTDGSAGASLTSAVVSVDDPQNNPTISSLTVTGLPNGYNPSADWLSAAGDGGTIGSSASAADNGGVCNVQVQISGPSGTVSSGGNGMGTLPSGYDSSTNEFVANSGATPAGCPTENSASTSGLSLNGLPSGTYAVSAQAQNPGNIVGSGTGSSNSIAAFNVDNQVPSVLISGGNDQWSANTDQQYTVSASETQNDSGISSITCQGSGLPAGGQTFSGDNATIPEFAQGDDAISCSATTGAGVSGADGSNVNSSVGTEGQGNDILIDTTTPSVAVDNDSPATQADGLLGDWVDPVSDGTPETVDVYAGAGLSGIAGTTSGTGTIDQWSTSGDPVTSGVSTEASLDNIVSGEDVSSATIGGNTYGMPYCTVTDDSDPDQTQPYVINDSVAANREGNPIATASVDDAQNYVEWQVPFTQNGHYELDCSVTNGAGVTTPLAAQTVEVDSTSASDLEQAAQAASAGPGLVMDATGDNSPPDGYVTTDATGGQSAAQWSGDPLKLTYTPSEATTAGGTNSPNNGDWPSAADVTDTTQVDPIVQTNCLPGGDASGEQNSNTVGTSINSPNPTPATPNNITIGDTSWVPQPDDLPASQTPTSNGNDQVVCTETNAAGTTSDPTTYYMNLDQQSPMVNFDQPAGEGGGQDTPSSSPAMTPAALAARTGLPQREFGLSPLTSKVAATPSNPVPATGHLAGAGPAEFKLNPHDSTTGVQYSDTATQVDATPNELSDLSGVYGEYCSDTNQTEAGSGGNQPQPYGDGGALGTGGSGATLDVPETGDADDSVTGIHYLDCYGEDLSTFDGSAAAGPFSGGGAQTTNYPFNSNQVNYNYTVNIDNVSPANIGWGIVNQGETVTDSDPYTYDPGQWYPDEATLTASAQGVGSDLSDIDAVVCGVNDPTFGQPNSTYTDPVSGQHVPYYDYTLDGNAFERPTDANNDYTVEIPVSDTDGSGTYYVSCFAVSGSGVNGTVTTTEVNLQSSASSGGGTGGSCTQFCVGGPDPTLNTPPTGVGPAPGGSGWHTTSEQVPVIAQAPTGSAPIESITCDSPPATLDGDTSNPNAVDNGDGTITYPNPAGTDSNTESITVTVGPPPTGQAEPPLECYATDGAGVDHTLGSTPVNIDDAAPTGDFIKPNASDPRKVTLDATDNNGSGIAKVIIQLVDNGGKIYNLPLTSSTTGDGAYTAELPPDNQMAKGTYTLQAIATDNAGNVTNPPINQWNNDLGSTISYPVLGAASMVDAVGAGTKAPLLPGDKGTTTTKVPKTKKIRVKTHVHGKVKWVKKTVKVYKTVRVRTKAHVAGKKTKWVIKHKKVLVYRTVKAAEKVVLANVQKPVKLAYAGKSTADGIVTTGSGVPIVGGSVQIAQNVGGKIKVLGTTTTNGSGRWVYHVPAGPSRDLAFEYMGTDVIDTATGSEGAEQVNGKVTLRAPKAVKVGKKLVLKGSLAGGFIPAKGVALRVYYTEKGAKGTGDYAATYHTTKKGAFTIKEPSRKSARGRTYTFWVKVVTPTSWPFSGAVSKKLAVKFR